MAIAVKVIIRGVSREQYDAVRAADGWLQNPPAGGISHLTWWDGSDCHNMDSWETQANFDAFAATRLGPAMAKAGVDTQPEITVHAAHEVLTPGTRTIAPSADVDRTEPGDVRVIRDAYAAFARGDIDAVIASLDNAITWTTPNSVRFGGVYEGRQGVDEFFSRLSENYDELHVEPRSYVANGDTVVVLGAHHGRTANGTDFEMPFAHVWTMRGGKALTFMEYFDTATMNAALGELAST